MSGLTTFKKYPPPILPRPKNKKKDRRKSPLSSLQRGTGKTWGGGRGLLSCPPPLPPLMSPAYSLSSNRHGVLAGTETRAHTSTKKHAFVSQGLIQK